MAASDHCANNKIFQAQPVNDGNEKESKVDKTVKVGMVGTGFVGDLHHASFKGWVHNAEVVAVASPTHAATFAEERGIARHYRDYHEMLMDKEIEVIDIGIPNDLHRQVVVDAARAGKHVIIEKPLCLTLEEADEMIEECKKAGVLLMYAEELLFAPKYVRAKKLIEEGAIGEPFLAKQSEEHPGPHMPWFWDVNRSGGGVMLDMGCHSIEYTRWVLGKPKVKSVTAFMGTYMHQDKTKGEDHSYAIIEYEGEKIAMIEEIWNYGFPQEMQHFANCVLGKETCMETGEDGREVLKIMYAAYQSAGEGRKIEFPYDPPRVSKPIDLWKKQ